MANTPDRIARGSVEPGFEGVGDAFERCFTELGETGASFGALVGGRIVADLWGGDGFGMGGLGGSLGMADPALRLAEAYVTRQMGDHARCEAVDLALRTALA